MSLMRQFVIIAATCLLTSAGLFGNAHPVSDRHLEELVGSASLEWGSIPSSLYEGAFLGDGIQGAMIVRDSNTSSVRMLLGHYKAISHYMIPGWEYCDSRVYAGSVIISPGVDVASESMYMDIWNGEVSGVWTTESGEVSWNMFSDRQNMVFVVSSAATGNAAPSICVRPEWGITPRFHLEGIQPETYAEHLPPAPEIRERDGFRFVVNRMKTRGVHTVVSKTLDDADGVRMYFAIGVSDHADFGTAEKEAEQDALSRIKASMSKPYGKVREENRKWWHEYYSKSSLRIEEDEKWQDFWWLQLYKFACASRSDSDFVMDTQGPWCFPSAWAGVWWNLNVQLSYMPAFSSNHIEEAGSFINGMDRMYKSGVLHSNTQGGRGITIGRSSTYEGASVWGDEFGNMPWLLYTYWRVWKYTCNDEYGRKLFPMMKENADFLISRMVLNKNGKYEIGPSRSPEYTEDYYYNANYSLMSARWLLETLIQTNSYFGYDDPAEKKWREVLAGLSPYPEDEFGLRVSSDQGFSAGHRHYSHLMAIYPYHMLSPYNPEERELIEKSVERWLGLTVKSGHSGYTFTGGSAMLSLLGRGNDALHVLDMLYDGKLTPNTMYNESGGQVIETPLSAVESIAYMLVQSYGGAIILFPAVPDKWRNLEFRNFRTEGAFLVSGEIRDGKPAYASIFSEKGGLCRLRTPYGIASVRTTSGRNVDFRTVDGFCEFETRAGREYRIMIDEDDSDNAENVRENEDPSYVTGFNPILPPWEHIPDGEPRVFGDRVYLYGSHDKAGSSTFCDKIYKVWSAPVDSLNIWTDHGISFRSYADNYLQDNIIWSDNDLYAPDVVEKDGKYYLYFYVVGAPGGVAVSDVPEGPFSLLSKYRKPDNETDEFGNWGQYIDPGVLVDDDGRVFIYWGYLGSHMAEINPENMYEILPDTYRKDIIPTDPPFNFFEAASMRKIDGKYYLIYADGGILVYATSDSPNGPFAYGGPIIRNGTDYPGGNIHGSLCNINGQWYIFYHRMTNNTIYSRKACVERVEIEADGSIKEVEMTSMGFSDGLDPFGKTPAYTACVLTGGNYITQLDSLTHPVVNNSDGSVAGFKYLDFDGSRRCSEIEVEVILKGKKGVIEVWTDGWRKEEGRMISSIVLPAGEGDTVLTAPVKEIKGRKAVYFVMRGDLEKEDICDFLSFRFVGE